MGKGIHDYVKSYLSKLKKKNNPGKRITGAKWLLSACKYPKTRSFAAGRHQPSRPEDSPRAATLSDVDRFLHENFHSLYAEAGDVSVGDDAEERSRSRGSPDNTRHNPPLVLQPSHPSFAVTAVEEEEEEEEEEVRPSAASDVGVPEESVAVMTFSKDPYVDFRRSMVEMVEARHADGDPGRRQPLDWDFMEDLLFCYLQLNDRTVHKYILGAFTDLTVSLRRQSGKEKRKLTKT